MAVSTGSARRRLRFDVQTLVPLITLSAMVVVLRAREEITSSRYGVS